MGRKCNEKKRTTKKISNLSKERVLYIIADVMSVIGILGIMFNFGRTFQGKLDRKVVETVKSQYRELYGEYQYYKAHSYILYGEDYYKEQGLLP